MAGNRAVVYQGPGQVEVRDSDYPTYEMKDGPGVNKANVGRRTPHGAILKTVATNICGSDQHMVRGRTTAPEGLVLGHEITGEVIDTGPDVEFIKVGDVCSVPFNISCGRCRNCKEGKTGVCLNVNPDRPGSAYGYVDMGGWVGGQAEYVMVPYADWNLLRFPDRDQAMEKILDLAMLTDIFPTGYHGCVSAGVDDRLHGVHRRCRPGRPGRRDLGVPAGRGRRHRRRPQRGAAGPGAQLRLRDGRRVRRATRWTRCSRSSGRTPGDRPAAGRRGRRRGRLRGPRARRERADRDAGHRAELADGPHQGRRRDRHPGPLRHRRPGRASTRRPRRARCRSGSASAGPSRTRSSPASAR